MGCNVSGLSSALTCSQQVVCAVCASVVIERPASGGDYAHLGPRDAAVGYLVGKLEGGAGKA